jgi:hypothetical protein
MPATHCKCKTIIKVGGGHFSLILLSKTMTDYPVRSREFLKTWESVSHADFEHILWETHSFSSWYFGPRRRDRTKVNDLKKYVSSLVAADAGQKLLIVLLRKTLQGRIEFIFCGLRVYVAARAL